MITKEELQGKILKLIDSNFYYDGKTYSADLEMVGNFLILWSLFENRCCEENANKASIENVIKKVKKSFDDNILNEVFDYMKERYADAEKFKNLNFRTGGGDEKMKTHCEKVFSGEESSKEDKLKAVLYVIYRYRNNLFHGIKQIPTLQEQKDNFNMAYKVLIECIEKYERKNTRKDLSVGKNTFVSQRKGIQA
ncbi:hypothetical protein ACFFUE_00370 [Bergeyella porcorum]|uniref:hypothetical protein n=1 Tax=Bergeyella porcorum TaxID=1735111 RepID=UPI0035E6F313